MKSRDLFPTTPFTIRSLRPLTHYILQLITVTCVALGIVCSALPGLAYTQGSPASVTDEYALGLSILADDSEEETPVTVTGELTILHADDFANKRGNFFYSLKDVKTNKIFNLHFAKKSPLHLRSGAIVTVRGKAKGQELFLAADEEEKKSIETVVPATEAVTGEQRTIVLVVNFLDASVSCSIDAIQDLMFNDHYDNSIDDFYQETSFGNVWFTGDVVGPYTIDYTSTGTCEFSAWANAADAAAQADGIYLSAYDRKVYVFPKVNPCGYGGLGTVGGNPSRAWIFYCGMDDLFAHELGHNLGMHHAATLTSEYGDRSDVMAIAGVGLRQVNAPHKEQMGWVTPEQVLTVSEDGIYDIAPLEVHSLDALAHQVLKIAKSDTNEYYYLSYRRPLGFDANLSSTYCDRLNVHRYKGSGAVQTYFLDALLEGETFEDAVNGVTITALSRNNDYMTVQVTTSATCNPNTPTVNLLPASQSGEPGMTLNYTFSLTNRDSSRCAETTFYLNSSLPGGWRGTLYPETLTLLPGETGSATLSVTSPVGTVEDSYVLKVDASDGSDPIHAASDSASYIVLGEDIVPPTAPTALWASVKPKQINLSWKAATDNVGVSGYAVWRDGARIGYTTGTSYADRSVNQGTTYIYFVTAYDAAGNGSAPSNRITVTARGGGKKR
jgi:hypothetical protein